MSVKTGNHPLCVRKKLLLGAHKVAYIQWLMANNVPRRGMHPSNSSHDLRIAPKLLPSSECIISDHHPFVCARVIKEIHFSCFTAQSKCKSNKCIRNEHYLTLTMGTVFYGNIDFLVTYSHTKFKKIICSYRFVYSYTNMKLGMIYK